MRLKHEDQPVSLTHRRHRWLALLPLVEPAVLVALVLLAVVVPVLSALLSFAPSLLLLPVLLFFLLPFRSPLLWLIAIVSRTP